MSGRLKIALVGAAAALALSAGNAQATTILNVSAASGDGITTFLDAGTYSLSFIGTAAGGAYDGWNAWSATRGCDGNGGNCAIGWANYLSADLGSAGLRFFAAKTGSGTGYFDTAALAAAAAANSPAFSFSLAEAQNVNFFIKDSIYSDNSGGVSLAINAASAVPEPASWAMMLSGFGALAAVMRHRKDLAHADRMQPA